jgi:hypothetical protein
MRRRVIPETIRRRKKNTKVLMRKTGVIGRAEEKGDLLGREEPDTHNDDDRHPQKNQDPVARGKFHDGMLLFPNGFFVRVGTILTWKAVGAPCPPPSG